ncbi:hypothetical protein WDU94_000364 [Cyamophila willieti]
MTLFCSFAKGGRARKIPTTPLSRQSTPNPSATDGSTVSSSSLRPSSCILASRLRRTPRKRLLLDDSLDGGGGGGGGANVLDTPTSSSGAAAAARRESIRRTRLQMKNRRSRVGVERTLSTSSSTSNLSTLSGNDVSSTTVEERLSTSLLHSPARSDTVDSTTSEVVPSMRTTRSSAVGVNDVNPGGRVLPNEVGVAAGVNSRSCSIGSESCRSLSSGSESGISVSSRVAESECGEKSKAHREDLKDQLCSLNTDQLRELLRDVLERNPKLMDEFGLGGGGGGKK